MKTYHTLYNLAYASLALATLNALTACNDLELVPEGQSTLQATADLELLLNDKEIMAKPFRTVGIIVNESYGDDYTSTVPERIAKPNTLTGCYLSYDETTDRAALASDDDVYTDIYEAVNYMNVIISMIDDATGNESSKPAIKAEATITRAYYLQLAAGIYAAQYDALTAGSLGGIAYPITPDVDAKPQLGLQETYDLLLDDCSEQNITLLPTSGNVSRITQAGGWAVRALVLFQMKRYDEALEAAEKSLALKSDIEDRSTCVENERWVLPASSENNLFYISPLNGMTYYPTYEQLSVETVALFEKGDYVMDYAKSYGSPYWDTNYGYYDSGIEGCREAIGYEANVNPWGMTVEQVMYLAAECRIRSGRIQEGLDLVNKVRQYRIDADNYRPFTASTEQEAMELLQRAKFIECIGSYVNFFDRKRWNSETAYSKTIIRDLGDYGSYSISPDSKLWIFPFPIKVMENNSTFRQNYE